MATKLEFIGTLPIFANLSEAARAAVAAITTEYSFKPNAVIAYQRDVANSLYIVKEGRLFAKGLDANGRARENLTRYYEPGQYFDDLWLFVAGVHPATVKGSTGARGTSDPDDEGRLLILPGPAFHKLLEDYPIIIDQLAPRDDGEVHYGLSDAAWQEARKVKLRRQVRASQAAALMPEERLEFFARRSLWLLAGRLVMPIILVLVAIIVLVIMPTDTGLQQAIKLGAPLLLTLIGLVWLFLRLIDWRGDYFVITNRHMTHHEFDLRHFRIRLVKIPIGQVQSVEVLKPSFLATFFNVGTARVTTAAAAGKVVFDFIDHPDHVKDVLERLSSQYRAVESAQTQSLMRQSIEKHFGAESPLKTADAGPALARARAPQRPEGFFAGLRRRYGWRVEEGNTITYRKSIFILLKRIAAPVVVLTLVAVLTVVALYVDVTPWVVLLAAVIFGFSDLLWLIWQVEDWRNDIFQVTDRFVIDIDRSPFGFGESRKQASISNIQNVNADRPGFLPTLFNYGFVSIDTAGSPSDIVFEYVPNPEVVQSDIFQRLDEFRQQQRVREGSARREEYALLIDVYRQAMEQQRIPQRTPPGFNEEENNQSAP